MLWIPSLTSLSNSFFVGTYIETKGNALIWQFRDADPEFGFMQSKELEEHLTEIMTPYQVDIIRGGGISDGYIEVRPSGVSKGLFLEHILISLQSINDNADFILAVGDDATDEPMFEQLCRLEASDSISSWSVTVGKKPSLAQSYVDDPNAVLDLLLNLVKLSQRDKRFFSSVDLSETLIESSKLRMNSSISVDKCIITKSISDNSLFRPNSTVLHDNLRAQPEREEEFSQNNSNFFPRNNSLVDITMKEYLDGINEVTNGDNDDKSDSDENTGTGLFF